MEHEVNFMKVSSMESSYIARSEWLLGTCNCVFTDWVISTYFYIEDKKPCVIFTVKDKMFSQNDPLYTTSDYEELEKWIEEHKEEIQTQIDTKADKWIEEHQNLLKQ